MSFIYFGCSGWGVVSDSSSYLNAVLSRRHLESIAHFNEVAGEYCTCFPSLIISDAGHVDFFNLGTLSDLLFLLADAGHAGHVDHEGHATDKDLYYLYL